MLSGTKARIGLAVLVAATAGPCSVGAQSAGTATVVQDVADDTRHVSEARGKRNFVVMPIPVSNPSIGNGLAIGALALYRPSGSVAPWTSGIGAMYTDTESWAAGVFQRANFANDRFRLTAFAGTGDFHLDFYGIGPNAGARGRSIAIKQEGDFGQAEGLIRVADHLHVGPMFRYLAISTTLDLDDIDFPDQLISEAELKSTSSALGVAAEYDTRDSEYGPRKGVYATAQYFVADDAFGSDFDYDRTQVAFNAYHHLSDTAVIAARLSVCDAGDGAPFYDLCAFGQNNDLRGYVSGQYRDHTMVAAQIEYRQALFGKFGMVVFAGVGGVGPAFSDISDELLPAAGLGLRYKASKDYGVNVSIDYAVGKDSDAVYFSIGEAF